MFELGEHTGEFHSGFRIPCNFCSDIYPTKEGLKEHEIEVHNKTTDINVDITQMDIEYGGQTHIESFKCKFCDQIFSRQHQLMKHNREIHKDSFSACWNFQAGLCIFHDDCWFNHDMNLKRGTQNFDCIKCENIFKTKAELSKHMKSNHIELVSTCRNYVQGKCEYDKACWFVHDPTDRIINTNEENEKLIGDDRILLKRLVEMVEKLNKRVVDIEKS